MEKNYYANNQKYKLITLNNITINLELQSLEITDFLKGRNCMPKFLKIDE